MLINIIGSPHSGKTTLAARLFDHFKTDDISSEFITERARQFIVEKRFRERLVLGQKVFLTDEDQVQIMKSQLMLEAAYVYSVPKQTIIVSDSSPLNTLLYLSPEGRKLPEVQKMIKMSLVLKPKVFWARVTPGSYKNDTNRIHDEKFSRQVDEDLPLVMKDLVPELQYEEVCGNPIERYHQVIGHLLKEFGIT